MNLNVALGSTICDFFIILPFFSVSANNNEK